MKQMKSEKNNDNPRMIFQPSKENREKIQYIVEKTGLSISAILNIILNDVEGLELNVKVIKNEKLTEQESLRNSLKPNFTNNDTDNNES